MDILEAESNQINMAMDEENENEIKSSCLPQNTSSSSNPDVIPPDNPDNSLSHHIPTFSTIIPNRVFVAGIDYKVSENDLLHVFSQYGAVREVKIVLDRSGMLRRYGFVTFESQEDAQKILNNADGIRCRDKKLTVGQAFKKHQPSVKRSSTTSPEHAMPQHTSCGPLYLTTSTGCPYTYHNGVAYFHCPSINPASHQWPPPSPLMLPQSCQPVCQQPTYQLHQVSAAFQGSGHFSPCHHLTNTVGYLKTCFLSASPSPQCVSNQYQWNPLQWQMPSSTVLFPQQPEYLYLPADGGSIQPPMSFMEDSTQEFLEPIMQHVYPVHSQGAEGRTPVVLQNDPAKNLIFPPTASSQSTAAAFTTRTTATRQSFQLPPCVTLPKHLM